MLTKKTPETFTATATVKCGDQHEPLRLTFFNRKTAELEKCAGEMVIPDDRKGNPIPWMNAQVCLFIIKSFDDGTDKEFPLTLDGLLAMEGCYPGVLMGLVQLFHSARTVAVEKN